MTYTGHDRPSADGAAAEQAITDPLVWLAAIPFWTDETAAIASFPAGDVRAFAKAASFDGWAEQRGTIRPQPGGFRFGALSSARTRLVHRAIGRYERSAVIAVIAFIAQRLQPHLADHRMMTPSLAMWIELALSTQRDDTGPLRAQVADAVRVEDLGLARKLVGGAEVLELVVGEPLTTAVRAANRSIHLGHRQRNDIELLAGFFQRVGQIRAVRDLVDGLDDSWALHAIGRPGTGKTLLARYLASGRFAEDLGRSPFPVARIDFDHISPSYPVARPVQLLIELAEDLAPYVQTTAQDQALIAFRRITESGQVTNPDGTSPEADNSLTPQAVSAFADLVRALPQPVLLILDTCEELAKLYPSAAAPAAPVVKTFELLQKVHDLVPSGRVLYLGRRPMTRGGSGWQLETTEGSGASLLPAANYLRRLDMVGFTEAEARQFLGRGSAPVPPPAPTADRILELSVARVSEAGLRSFNPYKLARYRMLWETHPDPHADAWRETAVDPYVETRIINRLQNLQSTRSSRPSHWSAGLTKRSSHRCCRTPALPKQSCVNSPRRSGSISMSIRSPAARPYRWTSYCDRICWLGHNAEHGVSISTRPGSGYAASLMRWSARKLWTS